MNQICSEFRVGELYSNEEIYKGLGVGNAGGLRFRIVNEHVTRAAVFTSVPIARKKSENPYHDRIENGILTYTAAGREGDQTLAGVNKRLSDQATLNFPIHGFIIIANRKNKSIGPKRWEYLGLLEYVRHFPDTQIDARGVLRNVWIFEFRVHSTPRAVPLGHDTLLARELLERSRRENPLNDDDLSIAPHPGSDSLAQKIDPRRIEAIRGNLLRVSPMRFEHLLKDLLSMTGFTTIEVTKYSQDGGIDLNAYAFSWALGKSRVQIQAKRWLHSVGRKEIAELRGSLQPFAKGTLITTSHFTKAALSEATEAGKLPIHLVDGFNLAQTVIANKAENLCREQSLD